MLHSARSRNIPTGENIFRIKRQLTVTGFKFLHILHSDMSAMKKARDRKFVLLIKFYIRVGIDTFLLLSS